MTTTIAVVGGGNIGSRHIQGLAPLPAGTELFVVDPVPTSRELVRTRYVEVAGETGLDRLTHLGSVSELPDRIDLGVIATTADVRRAVIEQLLSPTRTVDRLLLEKVLFQRPDDYERVGKLLAERSVQTWVNLPRRLFPAYRAMREQLADAAWIEYRVSGSNWGLGCNSVHFLDQVAWLAGGADMTVDNGGLDQTIVPAKRPGFIEFTGSLGGSCGKVRFVLSSHAGGDVPLQLTVDSDVGRYVIRESGDVVHTWRADRSSDWLYGTTVTDLPRQSTLTGEIARTLLLRDTSELADYSQAASVHQALISALLDHVEVVEGERPEACPIT